MKKFCDPLNEHAKNIIDFEKMLPLTKKELKSHEDAKEFYIYIYIYTYIKYINIYIHIYNI